MIKFQIYGSGCAKCIALGQHAEAAAQALGLNYELEKVKDMNAIIDAGVTRTPALADLIRRVAVEWMRHNGNQDLALLLSEQDAQALGDSFLARLQSELDVGVEVKPHPDLHAGFQIGGQGEARWFDFTDAALAESLAAYLHPRFAGVLDGLRQSKEGA